MKICPKCNKIMEDEAKFCSECAGELVPIEEEATVEEIADESDVQEEAATEQPTSVPTENSAAPAARGRSRLGMFLSMLLAVVAVAAMYIFYAELGFGGVITQKEGQSTVFYEKNGQIYCADKDTEYALTKDYPKELSGTVALQDPFFGSTVTELRFQASSDGKTVFFPDKEYDADNGSYSLYCMKLGDDASRYKIANRVDRYFIVSDGSAVYYLDSEGRLYRDDFNKKTVIDNEVSSFLVFENEDRVVYLKGKDLYSSDSNGKTRKLAAAVDEIRANRESVGVYYRIGQRLYYDDLEKRTEIKGDAECILANAGEYLVYRNQSQKVCLVNKGVMTATLDCSEKASDVSFADDLSAIYYAEYIVGADEAEDALLIFDLYCIPLKNGKPMASERAAFDAMLYDSCEVGVICFKPAGTGSELYLDDTLLGTDVSGIASYRKKLAFISDCDSKGNGTLKTYDTEKTVTVAQDAVSCGYTEKGELWYLSNVASASGKGELYLYTGDGSVLISQDVSDFWIVEH